MGGCAVHATDHDGVLCARPCFESADAVGAISALRVRVLPAFLNGVAQCNSTTSPDWLLSVSCSVWPLFGLMHMILSFARITAVLVTKVPGAMLLSPPVVVHACVNGIQAPTLWESARLNRDGSGMLRTCSWRRGVVT